MTHIFDAATGNRIRKDLDDCTEEVLGTYAGCIFVKRHRGVYEIWTGERGAMLTPADVMRLRETLTNLMEGN